MENYSEILAQPTKKYAEQLKNQDLDTAGFEKELKRLLTAESEIKNLLFDDLLRLGPITLHCKLIKSELIKKIEKMKNEIFSRIKKQMERISKQIEQEVQDVVASLKNEDCVNIFDAL